MQNSLQDIGVLKRNAQSVQGVLRGETNLSGTNSNPALLNYKPTNTASGKGYQIIRVA